MAKVLIVDDKELNLFALENVLKQLNVEIIKASNGDEALRATLNHEFALAILDVQMPAMDGYELAALLRSDARTRNIPIIFLSAVYSSDPYIFKGYESGGVDFITKPFNAEVLLSKVKVFLELNEQKMVLVRQKDQLEKLVFELEDQIAARLKVEMALQDAHDRLEHRVEERTSELMLVNRQLRHEITERLRAEEALKESGKELRSLSSKLLLAQEEERKRISGELHDRIGGSLTAIKFGLEDVLSKIEQNSPAAESLSNLISVSQLAIEESRRIYNDLRPTMLDDLGIVTTIGWYCRQFEQVYSGIQVRKEIRVEEGDIREPLKVAIFRIMQEAFHNIVKYSKTQHVDLSLVQADGTLQLAIKDHGIGFVPKNILASEEGMRGLGLTTMKERTELTGGTFIIESVIGEGTLVRAAWPNQADSE